MALDNRPIGVFDSGVGGLTVLRALADHFPQEQFIYVGDTARVPYGNKSPATIQRYTEEILHFLKSKKDVKAFVIACNSASANFSKSSYEDRPVYNVIEPGCDEALSLTKNKKIGVLGTRATVQSSAYNTRLKARNSEVEVQSVACPLFVPLAEEGWIDDPVTNLIAYRYLQGLKIRNVDTVILGCTHYPLLRSSIQRAFGANVTLVDSGRALSQTLSQQMQDGALGTADFQKSQIELYSTDESPLFLSMAKYVLSPLHFQNPEQIAI